VPQISVQAEAKKSAQQRSRQSLLNRRLHAKRGCHCKASLMPFVKFHLDPKSIFNSTCFDQPIR
jgi:hypothetical protein